MAPGAGVGGEEGWGGVWSEEGCGPGGRGGERGGVWPRGPGWEARRGGAPGTGVGGEEGWGGAPGAGVGSEEGWSGAPGAEVGGEGWGGARGGGAGGRGRGARNLASEGRVQIIFPH